MRSPQGDRVRTLMTTVAPGAPDDARPGLAQSTARETTMGSREVELQYVGHSTVLLELPGQPGLPGQAALPALRILTDPFLRDRLGPLRRHGPTPRPAVIGPIEIVAISHAHPDHFDRASLKRLAGDPLVIVPRGIGGAVRRAGLRAREVVVGEQVLIAPRWTITALPARHWRWPGAPTAATIGYLIEGPGIGIYFAGDTSRFAALRDLAGRVDLALLPVATWGPHMSPGHLSPRSAAQVARDIGARAAIPIHWGTLYPAGIHRFLGDRLTRPGARFAAWSRLLAPELMVHPLQPGESATIRL
jgi:L-ascorbate metabolism protein UlaG (beta-lactamase superfamily)